MISSAVVSSHRVSQIVANERYCRFTVVNLADPVYRLFYIRNCVPSSRDYYFGFYHPEALRPASKAREKVRVSPIRFSLEPQARLAAARIPPRSGIF